MRVGPRTPVLRALPGRKPDRPCITTLLACGQALEMQRQQLSVELKASQLRASDLTRQLEDTVELYNLEQGESKHNYLWID